MKIDFYTTSSRFNPKKESNNNITYAHPNLNPSKAKWTKGSIILVRVSNGTDYIIKILENGKKYKDNSKDDIKKRWGYYAKYELLKEYQKDTEKSRTIRSKLKKEILHHQNNCCWFCGDIFNDLTPCEYDHILEYSFGGLTNLKNLRALCKPCHQLKSVAFNKAKQSGNVSSEHWERNHANRDFFEEFLKKIEKTHFKK